MKLSLTLKRLAFIVTLAFVAISLQAQTQSAKHVVDRGETLESIAKTYNTTVEELVKLNPTASQFIYVGMELTVPSDNNINITSIDRKQDNLHYTTSSEGIKSWEKKAPSYRNNYSVESSYQKIEFEVLAGLAMNNYVGKDTYEYDMNMGFSISAGARYYIYKNLFVDAYIAYYTQGWKNHIYSSSGSAWVEDGANYEIILDKSLITHNIGMPIHIGYKINLTDEINFKIKFGGYVGYALSGKEKTIGTKETWKDIHSSELAHINKVYKISEIDDFKSFDYGIKCGVSLELKHFTVDGSFMRSFMKQYDSNCFAQNIIISIGYNF